MEWCLKQAHVYVRKPNYIEPALPMLSRRDPLVVGRVIGDVLDPFQPSIPIRVSYNNKDVSNGCEFKPSQVVNQPRVTIGGDDLRNFYTLVFLYLFIYHN